MNRVAGQIQKEITERGPIPFARFMELALYCPLYGFYERKADTTGRRGDFYTSVSVGPLFGRLLAFQFADWLEAAEKGPGATVRLVEAGAHDGRLAADILDWTRHRRPQLYERLEYAIIEPSARRQEWQRETLTEFSPRVVWFRELRELAEAAPTGRPSVCSVVFTNELLDALPPRRLGWDARQRAWFEWGVTLDADRFVWVRLPANVPPSIFPAPLPAELLDLLPDGFTTEVNPTAENWWRAAATDLQRGKLLTLDYGLDAEDFFAPQRSNGTVRAYHRHRLVADALANPGEQDITAHVNFSRLKDVGGAVGLKTELCASQSQFLTGIAGRAWQHDSGFGKWTSDCTRQFQTLTHPDYLGRSFRALVQSTTAD